jgi:hypothetical protein
MPENFLDSNQRTQPVWQRRLRRVGRAIQIWLRELIYSLLEVAILFTATAVLVGILLSFLEAFWYLYLQTPVGIKYTADPSRLSPHLLIQLFNQDLFLFSVEVATAALTASLIISAVSQILALRRYFYVGRGLLNRVIVLLLFSAAAGFKLAHTGPVDLPIAIGVSIVPSLCLFPSCINISARILPELTPLGIWKIIIKAKNVLIHSGDRVMPDPQASLSTVCSGTALPPPALKAAPSVKNHRARRVKPDVNDEGITPRSSIGL